MLHTESNSCDIVDEIQIIEEIVEIKDEKETVSSRFECAKCGQDFGSKSTLKLHIKTIHLKDQRYKCDECEYKTNLTDSLRKHHISHTQEKKFVCENCGKICASSSSLHVHIETIHNVIACNTCGKIFSRQSSLKRHYQRHAESLKETNAVDALPKKCPWCGKEYSNSTALKMHTKYRHPVDQRKLKCKHCSKIFHSDTHLKNHRTKCTGSEELKAQKNQEETFVNNDETKGDQNCLNEKIDSLTEMDDIIMEVDDIIKEVDDIINTKVNGIVNTDVDGVVNTEVDDIIKEVDDIINRKVDDIIRMEVDDIIKNQIKEVDDIKNPKTQKVPSGKPRGRPTSGNPKPVHVPTGKPSGRKLGQTKNLENRGAHLRKPDHLKVPKKDYVHTGNEGKTQ